MSTSGGLTSFSANRTCRGLQYDTPVLPKCLEPTLFADRSHAFWRLRPGIHGENRDLVPIAEDLAIQLVKAHDL